MRRPRRAMAEINVVPYIDVMLVLLIIFMVSAPLINPGQIDLPSVGQALNPTVAPLEVRLEKDGTIKLINRARGNVEQRVSQQDLLAAVRAVQAQQAEQAVVISADKSLRYEAVINVLDTLQQGQVKRVGLLAKPAS
jgi:biopolymer transport protein TolR